MSVSAQFYKEPFEILGSHNSEDVNVNLLVVTLGGIVGRCQGFGETYYFHFQEGTAQCYEVLNMFVRYDVFTATRV
jgi:hypothetical protein